MRRVMTSLLSGLMLVAMASAAIAGEKPQTPDLFPAPIAKEWHDVINPDGTLGRVYGWPEMVKGEKMINWYRDEQATAPPDVRTKDWRTNGVVLGHDAGRDKAPKVIASDPVTQKRVEKELGLPMTGQCKPDDPNCPDQPALPDLPDDGGDVLGPFKVDPLKRIEEQITRWAIVGVAAILVVGGILVARKRD